jgi:tRNA-Thr(GGU) m(6)t(6)A37 methyltransferase TsaA
MVQYEPIGVIKTPYKEKKGTPIQPAGARDIRGRIELDPKLVDGLKDLDGFSHIILVYHFHMTDGYSLHVQPYMDKTKRGAFATRIPGRPNPIGISVVRLDMVEGATIHIRDVDMLDGTPLLDIKPYVPEFDSVPDAEIGWLTTRVQRVRKAKSDGRTK